MLFRPLALSACLATASLVSAGETPAREGTSVYFANLADGDTTSAPGKAIFDLTGMGVAPAGTEKDDTGHHHLPIDRPRRGQGAQELEYGLPADGNHVHFGGGQTEVTRDLVPGQNALQLALGEHSHVPHGPPGTSDVITNTVE